MIVVIFCTVIHIGFAREEYTYYEPDFDILITNVTIIKEANEISEQFYFVGITVSTPTTEGANPATLETFTAIGDYSLGGTGNPFRTLAFGPDEQEIKFNFFLYGDNIFEGTEAFRAIISTVEGTPTFQDPNIVSLTTTINIIDDECKLKCMTLHVIAFHLCIVAMAGFEEPRYIIHETGGAQEVCVQVFNPPQEQPLVRDILLLASTSTNGTTAGKIITSMLDIDYILNYCELQMGVISVKYLKNLLNLLLIIFLKTILAGFAFLWMLLMMISVKTQNHSKCCWS